MSSLNRPRQDWDKPMANLARLLLVAELWIERWWSSRTHVKSVRQHMQETSEMWHPPLISEAMPKKFSDPPKNEVPYNFWSKGDRLPARWLKPRRG